MQNKHKHKTNERINKMTTVSLQVQKMQLFLRKTILRTQTTDYEAHSTYNTDSVDTIDKF